MVAEDWWDSCAFFKHQKKWISIALKQVISYSYQKIIKNSWQQPSKQFFGPFTIFFSSKQFKIDAKLIFGFLLIHSGGATINIWKKCPRTQFSGWAISDIWNASLIISDWPSTVIASFTSTFSACGPSTSSLCARRALHRCVRAEYVMTLNG